MFVNLIALHLNYCIEWFYINKKLNYSITIYNTFTVPCENSTTVSYAFSRMKRILVLFSRSKFAVKLIYWIALGSASNSCCLLKSIAIIL